jgi:hypothetical protein
MEMDVSWQAGDYPLDGKIQLRALYVICRHDVWVKATGERKVFRTVEPVNENGLKFRTWGNECIYYVGEDNGFYEMDYELSEL